MSPGILALVAVVALLTAVGVRELQDRLERWASDRRVDE